MTSGPSIVVPQPTLTLTGSGVPTLETQVAMLRDAVNQHAQILNKLREQIAQLEAK